MKKQQAAHCKGGTRLVKDKGRSRQRGIKEHESQMAKGLPHFGN